MAEKNLKFPNKSKKNIAQMPPRLSNSTSLKYFLISESTWECWRILQVTSNICNSANFWKYDETSLQAKAIYDFDAEPGTGEISIRVGEVGAFIISFMAMLLMTSLLQIVENFHRSSQQCQLSISHFVFIFATAEQLQLKSQTNTAIMYRCSTSPELMLVRDGGKVREKK